MSAPTFEHVIIDTVREAITTHLTKRLSESYNSPLDPFLKACIEKHAPKIADLYDQAVVEAIKGADLRASLAEAFTHKLARVLVGKFEGEIERRAGEMRSDPTFRAKVILAIEAAVVAAQKGIK